ncbi:hypothetical protein SAMN06296241_1217 [Salinimicrobium sediminis]|uniref:Uncharacterized protein n=1 Tax=Salinimicrobium sediminis TaxID=1343891 RepID=A0A285X2Z4_9FLAO|nr:hypothetical protein [Salinimicrobium sediminis]SOC79685.1 hypothetical protein SAMN06296241_1217 [Salinimicrobium sediminis]
MATLKKLKSWFYPVTPLTVVTPFSIIIALYAIYLGVTVESPAIIYPIVVVPITLLIVILYGLDRFLIKEKVSYYIVFIVELVLLAGGYFQINYMNSRTDIHINTDEDYIFVLYDARENSMDRFTKKGLFSKELLINDNIVHLDSSLRKRDDIGIFPPDSWVGTGYVSGKYFYKGDSIPYNYMYKSRRETEFARSQQTYIDSLLNLALQP